MLVNNGLFRLIIERNNLKYKLVLLYKERAQYGRFSIERDSLDEQIINTKNQLIKVSKLIEFYHKVYVS